MKKILLLILVFLLTCLPLSASAESLIGTWQEENYDKLYEDQQPCYKLHITDDGYLYLLISAEVTDIGWHTQTLEYQYTLNGDTIETTPVKHYQTLTLKPKKDKLILNIFDHNFTLIKASEPVPYRFTKAGKEAIAAEKQATRDEIIAFAAKLSTAANHPLELSEDNYYAGDIPHVVQFSTENIILSITLSKYAWDNYDGTHYFRIPPEGLSYEVRCYIVDDYAVVFSYYADDETLAEWLEVLEKMIEQ